MAQFKIHGGSSFETATTGEIWDLLDKRERERARGVRWVEFAVPLNASPASQLTVGPPQGFSWAVRVVSSTLGSAGTLAAYKASDSYGAGASASAQTARLVGFGSASQTAQVLQFPSDTLFLQHGTAVWLVASTTLTNYYIAGWEVIAEQAWKVAD